MEVEIRNSDALRSGWVSGQDIYAIIAPIVEALERVVADGKLVGAVSQGGVSMPSIF
jgi:hypothetical protein